MTKELLKELNNLPMWGRDFNGIPLLKQSDVEELIIKHGKGPKHNKDSTGNIPNNPIPLPSEVSNKLPKQEKSSGSVQSSDRKVDDVSNLRMS